jgi:hypothetical protein
MFIKLPDGMSGADYIAQKSGVPFPAGAVDCGGLGLMSPASVGCGPCSKKVNTWPRAGDLHFTKCKPRPSSCTVCRRPSNRRGRCHRRLIDFRFELVESARRALRYDTVGPSMQADLIRLDEDIPSMKRARFRQEIPPAPGVLGGGLMDSNDLKRGAGALHLRRDTIFLVRHADDPGGGVEGRP